MYYLVDPKDLEKGILGSGETKEGAVRDFIEHFDSVESLDDVDFSDVSVDRNGEVDKTDYEVAIDRFIDQKVHVGAYVFLKEEMK